MKTKMLLTLLICVSSAAAYAETSEWSFKQKNSGPDQFDCGSQVRLDMGTDAVKLAGDSGSVNMILENINQGKVCNRTQNGGAFGTLRCKENVVTQTESNVLVESFECSTGMPFVKSCNTRRKGPSSVISVDVQANELTVRSATGWQGQGQDVLECVYKARAQ